MYVTGPGHGAAGILANVWLEGTYSEYYPEVAMDEEGMRRLFKQFSFPGGVPSHTAPETPGSINEGGELGYSLSHAFGAAFDNPGLIVACVVGDGEAETGPLATAWHSNKFLNPARDGAVLPILHLNGYKIANPAVLARIEPDELDRLLTGYGYEPVYVEGDEPETMHQKMAAALDRVLDRIGEIQKRAREDGEASRPRWPMIVLRTPKGWTCPRIVDGHFIEGYWRAHQVPFDEMAEHPEHVKILEDWMRGYRPEELFDENGRPRQELLDLAPKGDRRMGANPHTNGGRIRIDLRLPDFTDYAVAVAEPGKARDQATRVLGRFLRDTMARNEGRFRVTGADETASNRLDAIYDASEKQWMADYLPVDADGGELSRDGRVMEILSEHTCLGWLEGYVLTGRHGLFNSYEAFAHIVDSMFNQHSKWLKTIENIPWREPLASVNILLSSHVWRQDYNGFSHQDPGFIDMVLNKKGSVVRVYLPPDANCLLSVADHCLRSHDYVNVIVAGKQSELQFLDMESAIKHCTAGIGMWRWASNDGEGEPEGVIACAGDVPTVEALAATAMLRKHVPDLKVRLVNVVDLSRLSSPSMHPHGLPDDDFDALFTRDKPVIFAYHGYPWLVHRLTYKRSNHDNIHVHGFIEEGTTTTPFDIRVMNRLDRYHLFQSAVERIPRLEPMVASVRQLVRDKLVEHEQHIRERGRDMPEIRDWTWPY